MIRTFDACGGYIMETRRRQDRPVYEAFERLVTGIPRKML
jgi:hypothetical protein